MEIGLMKCPENNYKNRKKVKEYDSGEIIEVEKDQEKEIKRCPMIICV